MCIGEHLPNKIDVGRPAGWVNACTFDSQSSMVAAMKPLAGDDVQTSVELENDQALAHRATSRGLAGRLQEQPKAWT